MVKLVWLFWKILRRLKRFLLFKLLQHNVILPIKYTSLKSSVLIPLLGQTQTLQLSVKSTVTDLKGDSSKYVPISCLPT